MKLAENQQNTALSYLTRPDTSPMVMIDVRCLNLMWQDNYIPDLGSIEFIRDKNRSKMSKN